MSIIKLHEKRCHIMIVWKLANFGELRSELYYFFGLLCLISWLAFNLWILRDYFFPWWFSPLYTETGLPKQKLEMKKKEILLQKRVIDDVKILPNTHTIFLHDSVVCDQITPINHNESEKNIVLKMNDEIYDYKIKKEIQNNMKNSIAIEM
uniref:Cation-transporting ATPase n=1 Tax=Strongyloides papillosus TaxID=174720 RepID=A0A0N5C8T2_STREA